MVLKCLVNKSSVRGFLEIVGNFLFTMKKIGRSC